MGAHRSLFRNGSLLEAEGHAKLRAIIPALVIALAIGTEILPLTPRAIAKIEIDVAPGFPGDRGFEVAIPVVRIDETEAADIASKYCLKFRAQRPTGLQADHWLDESPAFVRAKIE